MTRSAPVLLAVAGVVALVPAAFAASSSHVGVDHTHDVRFSLTGRALTITLQPVADQPNPLIDELPGHKLDAACNGRSAGSKKKLVASKLSIQWKSGKDSKTFTLDKDVSAHVQWCVIEYQDTGVDIAVSEKMRVPNPNAPGTLN